MLFFVGCNSLAFHTCNSIRTAAHIHVASFLTHTAWRCKQCSYDWILTSSQDIGRFGQSSQIVLCSVAGDLRCGTVSHSLPLVHVTYRICFSNVLHNWNEDGDLGAQLFHSSVQEGTQKSSGRELPWCVKTSPCEFSAIWIVSIRQAIICPPLINNIIVESVNFCWAGRKNAS